MTEIDLARDVRRAIFDRIPALQQLSGSERLLAEFTIEREVEDALYETRSTLWTGDPDAAC